MNSLDHADIFDLFLALRLNGGNSMSRDAVELFLAEVEFFLNEYNIRGIEPVVTAQIVNVIPTHHCDC